MFRRSIWLVALLLAITTTPVLAQGRGYAWANDPSAASYAPSATYAYNSSGGGITATRSGAGVYSMTFAGLGGRGSAGGTVQVTAYGGREYCNIANWDSGGADFRVNVRCFTPAGQPADSRYSISVEWPKPGGREGYAWANDPSAASYAPSAIYAYNSSGGRIMATRSGAGVYSMTFAGLGGGGSAGGTVLVTAYGGRDYCNIMNWDSGGADFRVNVRCFTPDGQPADSRYSISVAW